MTARCSGDDSAFPRVLHSEWVECVPGLKKREYFAGLALQGLLAAAGSLEMPELDYARDAVRFADLLIAELNRKAGE